MTCDRTRVRRCVTVAVCGRLALHCGICTVTVPRWQPGTELSCLARVVAVRCSPPRRRAASRCLLPAVPGKFRRNRITGILRQHNSGRGLRCEDNTPGDERPRAAREEALGG